MKNLFKAIGEAAISAFKEKELLAFCELNKCDWAEVSGHGYKRIWQKTGSNWIHVDTISDPFHGVISNAR